MCGITGIYAFNEVGRFFSINLHAANEVQNHRGPDQSNLFHDHRIGLGHKRLSILDVSLEGRQPMTDETGRYTIAYNGEVYNFKALRDQLQSKGVTFHSGTDTEVLLKLYIDKGESFIDDLIGFFSFAIYDQEEEKLFAARDRIGIKPFCYYVDEDKFIFASEISSILAYNVEKKIDYTSLYQYFQLNYVPAPNTIFENIYKLQPGHCLSLKGRDLKIRQYYNPPFKQLSRKSIPAYDDAKKELLKLLDTAVTDRLVSDVPLGTFLSGGIDSSTVTALAARQVENLNTFSVGYRDEPLFDETEYAMAVAEKYKTNHTVFKLSNDDYFEHILDLMGFWGEPFGDSSAIPTYILCQRTRQKVTVSLSGDGADEVFAGYNKHFGEWKARENGLMARTLKSALPLLSALPKTRNSKWGNKIRQAHRFAEGMTKTAAERYWYLSSWRSEERAKAMFNRSTLQQIDFSLYGDRKAEIVGPVKGDDFNDLLYADMKLLLPNDMLHKVDSMSMANSLEVRVPLLDHRIVDFGFSLPADYKISGKMKKMILQDAVREILPEKLYNRPKQGFDVPLAKGFKRELRSMIEDDLLSDSLIEEQGIFDSAYIKSLKHTIFNTNNFDQTQVFGLLSFQFWWKKHMKGYKAPSHDE